MNRTVLIICLLMVLTLSLAGEAQNQRQVMLLVNGPSAGFIDGDLGSRLEKLIGSKNKFSLVPRVEAEVLLQHSAGRFDSKQLIERGLKLDCRYIIWCDIGKEELALEKHFSLPFILSQRRVAALLEIDYQVVDCHRGRIVHSDRIEMKRVGSSSLQYFDNSDADPGLYLPYLERKRLFDQLEDDAAEKIFSRLERIAKQR